MENNDVPEKSFIEVIVIKTIIFDDSECVTIWGYIPGETMHDLIPCDFICQFNVLTDLLLCGDIEGEKIIEAIAEKLSKELEIPTIITMEELFGTSAVLINNIVAETSRIGKLDNDGKWIDPNELCYQIELVETKSDYFKKYKSEIKLAENHLHDCFIILNNAFKYFEQLIAKDFSQKEARKRAGLTNELLFRIAYLKNKAT